MATHHFLNNGSHLLLLFYNKSMFSPRRKHHRRKSKDSSHQESDHDTKRSRRHRELSPIVWNFTGSTKPSVNNYKLIYSKTSSNSTPRFSIHSHGKLSETPISVRCQTSSYCYCVFQYQPRNLVNRQQIHYHSVVENQKLYCADFQV
jgi:hypothetical protein